MADIIILLIATGLVVSALGFVRLVYFISVGYGFSVAAMAVVMLVWYAAGASPWGIVQVVLILLYGVRLGVYLAVRESGMSYAAERTNVEGQYRVRGVAVKLAIWVGVSLLYAAMVSPALFHIATARDVPGPVPIVTIVGLAAGYLGLVVESLADFQKSRSKRIAPDTFTGTGLYRVVRFPNYFGEILVWLGSWIAGLPFYGASVFRWTVAAAGVIIIILIMLGSARRLEIKQEERYGSRPEFRQYASRTPVLFPFLPLYSLKKLRVYLG